MTIGTGTPETRTEHSEFLGLLNEVVAIAIPAILLFAGITSAGWDAISWAGAIVWGIVGAAAMGGFVAVGRAVDITSMDLLDLLGSVAYEPGTTRSRGFGFIVHAGVGALLAVTGVYTLAMIGWAVTWLSGMIWGALVSGLALLLFSSIGLIHPKIRAHRQDDPGPAGTHFGSLTPFGIIMAHLVYGLVFGGLYQIWPLA